MAKHLCVCARVCVRARERERARARERESAWERARGERACVLYPQRRSTSIQGRLVEQLHPLCMRTRHAAPQPARLPSRMGGWPPAGPFHLISRARAARPPVVAATRGCYANTFWNHSACELCSTNHTELRKGQNVTQCYAKPSQHQTKEVPLPKRGSFFYSAGTIFSKRVFGCRYAK